MRLAAVALAMSILPTEANAQTTHTVNLNAFSFSPALVNIEMGDTVRWNWVGGFHNVVSGVSVPDGIFSSGSPVPAPAIFEVTFDADFLAANTVSNNDYDYYCDVHLSFGMTGRVHVNAPLAVASNAISLSSGGSQAMGLTAGVSNAGGLYIFFGSASGFSPGSFGLPLNFDAYQNFTFNKIPNPLFSFGLGILNAAGEDANPVSFNVPPLSDPTLAGIRLWHAFSVLDAATFSTVTLVSNAQYVDLIP